MVWRDEATLAAMALVHAAGAEAMRVLERRLDGIAVADAMTSADAVARKIVRPAMRAVVAAAAHDWFTSQARALRQVDARLEALALRFAAMSERPVFPPDVGSNSAGWSAPEWLRGPVNTISAAIERAAGETVKRALPAVVRDGAGQISARIGREIGERSGAHDRVRASGQSELSRIWLGPAPENASPRPYLTQLLDIVDRIAREAKETIA